MAGDGIEIGKLDEHQIAAAGAMLAQALFDDPISVYAMPDEAERARRMPQFIAAQVRYAHLFGMVEMTSGWPDGVAIWLPPTGAEETPERLAAAGLDRLPEMIGQATIERFSALFAHMEQAMHAVAPAPHWYLSILGIESRRQRQGLGSALLRVGLERAAAEGVPAALLTANPSNVPFYHRNGMQIAHEGIEPSSGISFWIFTTSPPS